VVIEYAEQRRFLLFSACVKYNLPKPKSPTDEFTPQPNMAENPDIQSEIANTNVSYLYLSLEYTCLKQHRNTFDFLRFPDAQSALPRTLPCADCNYEMVQANLVEQFRCDFSEAEFSNYKEQKYAESAAYHEAGHVVIAAVEQSPLKNNGIRIDQKGNGFSHFATVQPTGVSNVGADPLRESAVRSTRAGFAAQERFFLRYFKILSSQGAGSDERYIEKLLYEMYSDTSVVLNQKIKLYGETAALVDNHWPPIEALARKLWIKTWTNPAPASGERRWSQQLLEKKMDGSEVVDVLQQFKINAKMI